MQIADKKRFVSMIAALAEAFGQDYSPKKLDIYYTALEDLSIEDIERGAWTLIRTRGTATFPKVAEIREAIGGKASDRAMLALQKVERALREVGAYNSIVFDDPIIHRVVNSFDNGWIGIADMTIEGWIWARKDFLKLYEAFSASGIASVPHKLKGRIETDNENRGYQGKFLTVYFGGKNAAIAWQSQIPEQITYGNLVINSVLKVLENKGEAS